MIHTRNQDVVRQFSLEKPVNRILINTPAALCGIGATTNITPALTLGCGAIGGGSSPDNVGPMNLLNIRSATAFASLRNCVHRIMALIRSLFPLFD